MIDRAGRLRSISIHLTDVKGATFDGSTDSLEALRNAVNTTVPDAAGIAAGLHVVTDALINGIAGADTAAIADAVWDEATAGHVAAGSFGKELQDIGAITGAGATQQTIVVKDGDGNVIADADVWLTNDEAGDNVVAGTSQSNSAGNVTFLVDVGVTYYIWAQKDGQMAVQGQEWTVT